MAEIICIVCPKGCRLQVDETTLAVTGNACQRGAAYGPKELTNPTRVLTSTVRITGGTHRRLPVKTQGDVPKGRMFDIVNALSQIEMVSPVRRGDVVLRDACQTGVDVVATRDM